MHEVLHNCRGGGIEPLPISRPRELKSRPSTSLSHHGISASQCAWVVVVMVVVGRVGWGGVGQGAGARPMVRAPDPCAGGCVCWKPVFKQHWQTLARL